LYIHKNQYKSIDIPIVKIYPKEPEKGLGIINFAGYE